MQRKPLYLSQQTTKHNYYTMENQKKQAEQFIANISIGTPLFVNPLVGARDLEAYTRGEAPGEKFAEICKKNKTSVWIKLNNGEVIKTVYAGIFKAFLKPSAEQKPTIKEWRVITQSGSRYNFKNEQEAIKKHKALWSKGDKAQLINVWS